MDIHGAPVAGLTNRAGNHAYVAARLHESESIDQLQEIVGNARSLRVLGSRHSFNDPLGKFGNAFLGRYIFADP